MADTGLPPLAWNEEEEVRKRWLRRTLGNCEIEAMLGTGAMGVVFRGRHVLLNKPVAIKVLPRRVASAGAGHIERLLQEARAAGALEHAGIVQVYDINVTDEGDYYIIMQLVEGTDLKRLVSERGPLPYGSVVNIALQVSDALLYLHGHGFIHRDLKPSNIFVNKQGQVKLGDLGLVKSLGEPGKSAAGLIVGTPEYMAPEQAKGTEYTYPASDIYALGGTMYYMLTGRSPFVAETSAEALIKHATESPVPIVFFRPDIPKALGQLVEAMLEKTPSARPTLSAVVETLHRLEGKDDPVAALFLEYSLDEEHLFASVFLVQHGSGAGYISIAEVEEALRVQAELFAHGSKMSLARILLDEHLISEGVMEAIKSEYAHSLPQAEEAALAKLAASGHFPQELLALASQRTAAAFTRPLERLLRDGSIEAGQYKRYERLVRNQQRCKLRQRLLSFLPIGRKEQAQLLARLEDHNAPVDASVLSLAASSGLISEETARTAAGLLFKQVTRESAPGSLSASFAFVSEPVAPEEAGLASLEQFHLEEVALCPNCGRELDAEGRCPRCSGTAGVAATAPSAARFQQRLASKPQVLEVPYPRRQRSGKGAWGILTADPSDASGYTLEDLKKLTSAGYLDGNMTVKGPTTGGNWLFARRAPGLARILGNCPHCLGAVKEADIDCPHCNRRLDMPLEDTPKPSRSRFEALRDWL